mmetsp:Transcript_45217/g.96195  ORF Transcript_45217/g.96195 Transcript_45217/m.96195 type:complete len:201 (+) Transcript_45217:348-950(+)
MTTTTTIRTGVTSRCTPPLLRRLARRSTRRYPALIDSRVEMLYQSNSRRTGRPPRLLGGLRCRVERDRGQAPRTWINQYRSTTGEFSGAAAFHLPAAPGGGGEEGQDRAGAADACPPSLSHARCTRATAWRTRWPWPWPKIRRPGQTESEGLTASSRPAAMPPSEQEGSMSTEPGAGIAFVAHRDAQLSDPGTGTEQGAL